MQQKLDAAEAREAGAQKRQPSDGQGNGEATSQTEGVSESAASDALFGNLRELEAIIKD